MAKKMTQKQLADAINEKQSVVNDYESGKAVPNGAVIQKLNKANPMISLPARFRVERPTDCLHRHTS